MVEEKEKNKERKETVEKPQEQKQEIEEEKLIRILAKDIPGNKKVYSGLTMIKGISWIFSAAICGKLGIDKDKRIQELSAEEIEKITQFVKNPDVPDFLKNRRKDLDSGEGKHLNGNDLELRGEFDIKRLKKIKSYKGIRHQTGHPVRGQRTRSNFRTNRKKSGAVGVRKSK